MKPSAGCFPCYLNQAIQAMNRAGIDDEQQRETLVQLMKYIPGLAHDRCPAETTSHVLHRTAQIIGVPDPFREAKEESNRLALSLLSESRDIVACSGDRILTALKIAVAGNIIDLGIFAHYDVRESLSQVLRSDFTISDYAAFKQMIAGTGTRLPHVVIMGDNSGEIVFDRLLLEELKRIGLQATYVVKGGPVLNDATFEDAVQAGLTEYARVITTGNNFAGMVFDRCAPDCLNALEKADVIVSKGQANYESLEENQAVSNKTFFLLKAKCPAVAANLKVKVGDIVFKKGCPQ